MSHPQLQALFSDASSLQTLVGRKVRYLGDDYVICDLLVDENMLVLSSDSDKAVQDDSFGRAHRMVPKQHRLTFRDINGNPTAIWDEFIFLDGAL